MMFKKPADTLASGFKENQQKLEKIAREVARCTRCGLHKQATNSVPGEGNPSAEIMFIGEAPGYHEDQQGIPFCGAAGRLLDQLLQSIEVKRKDVFIGNVLKHRPPGNRDPLPEEMEACRPFLDEQIKTIDPRMIVTLGRFSMNKFLPGEYISRIHGQARFINLADKKRIIIPMYHPAAALRNGKIMKEIKEDFQEIKKFLFGEPEIAVAKEENKEEQLSLV